jgi:hypothetical protein
MALLPGGCLTPCLPLCIGQQSLEVLERWTIGDERIHESSGLAASRDGSHDLWTHNDSGDTARLFRLSPQGKPLGTLQVGQARALDWEDIASGVFQGRRLIWIGDLGGNSKPRKFFEIYAVEEPEIDKGKTPPFTWKRDCLWTLRLEFPEAGLDFESLAFDPVDGCLLLASKSPLGGSFYRVEIPPQPGTHALAPQRIAPHRIPMATSADLSQDGKQLLVLSYIGVFRYQRMEDSQGRLESWNDCLNRTPEILQLPPLRQAEAIGWDDAGKDLWVSSEQAGNAPLWKLRIPEKPKP